MLADERRFIQTSVEVGQVVFTRKVFDLPGQIVDVLIDPVQLVDQRSSLAADLVIGVGLDTTQIDVDDRLRDLLAVLLDGSSHGQTNQLRAAQHTDRQVVFQQVFPCFVEVGLAVFIDILSKPLAVTDGSGVQGLGDDGFGLNLVDFRLDVGFQGLCINTRNLSGSDLFRVEHAFGHAQLRAGGIPGHGLVQQEPDPDTQNDADQTDDDQQAHVLPQHTNGINGLEPARGSGGRAGRHGKRRQVLGTHGVTFASVNSSDCSNSSRARWRIRVSLFCSARSTAI